MYYTIYKITNKINGKFYVGTHKTKNLDDDYMGSGKYLNYAISKHGIENFEKEILFVFDNPDEMYDKEAEIVNKDFVTEKNTYNLKAGGYGGWDYINENKLSGCFDKNVARKGRIAADIKLKQMYGDNWRQVIAKKSSEKIKKILKENPNYLKEKRKDVKPFLGRKHSAQTKKLMSNTAKERLKDPKNNSQYGTMWITDGKNNKKIKKSEPISEGWVKGRTINYE